jgi:hypothetical protein
MYQQLITLFPVFTELFENLMSNYLALQRESKILKKENANLRKDLNVRKNGITTR